MDNTPQAPAKWEEKAGELGRSVAESSADNMVVSLWPASRTSLSYWVLFVSGINRPDEMKIAEDILVWNAFLSKEVAQFVCAQSSEIFTSDLFHRRYGIRDMPCLMVSNEPSMRNAIVINSDTLRHISKSDGDLQQFLARTQMLLTGGGSLRDVGNELRKEIFWRWAKGGWSEIKSILSITLSASQES